MLFVFMSQPDFACNPHALWKYVTDNTDHETAWIVKRIEHVHTLRNRGIECELYDTVGAERLLSKADYIVANSYTFQQIEKRPDQIMVNLWHGSGIKAHDYYDHLLNPKHAVKLKKFFQKVDLMCVHSLDDRFRLSAQLNYDMRRSYVTGQARLDCVKSADGKSKLVEVLGTEIASYDKIIFFAPSFRANMSCHSGKFISDNIFRTDDFDDVKFSSFLKKHNAAFVYKLHPIEQTAFKGREFAMNSDCYELTDDMLFSSDIRYTELLNGFDVMISDYSSIAYDYLTLNRPIIYLIPDYNEYKEAKGFVFNNIDYYMPGEKVLSFENLLVALEEEFANPDRYLNERNNVIRQRFDFLDDKAAERCYNAIMNFQPPVEDYMEYKSNPKNKMPSDAQMIKDKIKDRIIIDSTAEYTDEYKNRILANEEEAMYYITSELPDEFKQIHSRSSAEIADLAFYNQIKKAKNIQIIKVQGGVDYNFFKNARDFKSENDITRIGFAGTIDNRIYFAMVQCLCEVFKDAEIVFAGDILGDFPVWLNGYDNLKYIEASYEELPDIIRTFDVAILPFFGRHQKTVPSELFQYLASGKMVVTSDMPFLPECKAVLRSKSISDAAENVKIALRYKDDKDITESAYETARENDWQVIAEKIFERY